MQSLACVRALRGLGMMHPLSRCVMKYSHCHPIGISILNRASFSTVEPAQVHASTCSSNKKTSCHEKDPQQVAEEEIAQLQAHIRTHFQHANYTAALAVSESALQKTMALFAPAQPNHPAIASAHNNIGLMHKMMGNYHLALPQYQRALDIYADVVGKDHASYAAALNNIGNLYRAQAIQTMTQPSSISDNGDDDDDDKDKPQELLTDSPTLPNTRIQQRQYVLQVLLPSIHLNRQALDCFTQSYAIRKVELGPEHVHTISSQSNYGATIAALILLEETYKQIRSMITLVQEEDTSSQHEYIPPLEETQHGNTTSGESESNHNRWDLAEVHLRAAFRTAVKNPRGTRINNHGDDSVAPSSPLKKDRTKGKKERRKQVEESKRAQNTTDQEDTTIQTVSAAAAAQNLAVFLKTKANFLKHSTHQDMEAYMEAKNLYLGSLKVRKALLGDSHPDTVTTKFSLAELLDVLGDADGAKALREEILNAYEVSEINR